MEKEVIIQEVKERDCQSTGQIEIDYHEIIAICDSIDAMTSTRSYRKAHDSTFCYEEIKKNLGTMYDPVIGAYVLEHWEEITKKNLALL